jgi:hypothetical protein
MLLANALATDFVYKIGSKCLEISNKGSLMGRFAVFRAFSITYFQVRVGSFQFEVLFYSCHKIVGLVY